MFRKLFGTLAERRGIGKERAEVRRARQKRRDQKGKRKLEQGRARKENKGGEASRGHAVTVLRRVVG